MVPGSTAKLRWTPAAGATSARYFVYVARNGAAARIEASVTGTEVMLDGLPGDAISVSVAAVSGTVIGPRSAPSETIRFGATPPTPGRLVMSCASCGVSALVRFPDGATFGLWPHPSGATWDLVDVGRFSRDSSASLALVRERLAGGWLVGTLGSDSLRPLTSIVKGVFAGGMPLTGDLDGDGVLEILIQDRADDDIEVWQVQSGSLRRETRMPLDGALTALAIEDLDGDGQRDLFYQHDSSGAVGAMLTRNLDDNGMVMLASGRPFDDSRVVDVADYDGDGRVDLLWRSDAGRMAVMLLRGDPLRPVPWLRPLPERAGDDRLLPRTSADLDGVPGAEIVVQSSVDGSAHALWALDTSGRRQILYVPPGGTRWEVVRAMR